MKVKTIERISTDTINVAPSNVLSSIRSSKKIPLPHIDDEELVPLWFALTGNMNYAKGAFEYDEFWDTYCTITCINVEDIQVVRERFLKSIEDNLSLDIYAVIVKAYYEVPSIIQKIKVAGFDERPALMEQLKQGMVNSLEQKMNDIEKYQMNIIAI